MIHIFFDLISGKTAHSVSDNILIDSDGNQMVVLSGNTAMDLSTGEIHPITPNFSNDNDPFGNSGGFGGNDPFGHSGGFGGNDPFGHSGGFGGNNPFDF